MEVLQVLEEKIARLIESKKQDLAIIAALKQEVVDLKKENDSLVCDLQNIEKTLSLQKENRAHLDKERTNTKSALDNIISSIDALIDSEATA